MEYSAPNVDYSSNKNGLGVFHRSKVVELGLNLLCKSWTKILKVVKKTGEKLESKIVS